MGATAVQNLKLKINKKKKKKLYLKLGNSVLTLGILVISICYSSVKDCYYTF